MINRCSLFKKKNNNWQTIKSTFILDIQQVILTVCWWSSLLYTVPQAHILRPPHKSKSRSLRHPHIPTSLPTFVKCQCLFLLYVDSNTIHTSPCPHAMSECVRSPLASGQGCWLKILQHKQALPLESRTPALQSKVQPRWGICCHSPNIIKPINRATVCQSPIDMINPARTRHRPRDRQRKDRAQTKIQSVDGSTWDHRNPKEKRIVSIPLPHAGVLQEEETEKTHIAFPPCVDV